MNETLMALIIQNLLFLELSGDDVVNPDAAVRETEHIASELSELSDSEKHAFIAFVEKYAAQQAATGQSDKRVTFMRELPETLGLLDDED